MRTIQRPDAGRRLILTAAGPTMHAVLHDLSLPSFQRYAQRWGYAVRAVDLPSDGSGADAAAQTAKWAKVRLLREALAGHEMVLWLDADVLLLRDDEDVADHLLPGDFQALALEQVPAEHRVNPNTGVWLLRGPSAVDFLDQVERLGPQPGPWADQGAVLAALGWDRGDESYAWARPGRGSPYLTRTSWLPPGWNQPYVDGRATEDCFNSSAVSYADRPTVDAPHALHFMGLTPQARHRHMSALTALTASAAAIVTDDDHAWRHRVGDVHLTAPQGTPA
ncbi:MAG TPA: hypothetical protein VF423_15200 [Actinomycetes bacterium]